MGEKLSQIKFSTFEVLHAEVNEIFRAQFPSPTLKHKIPCFFTMSVNDPLIDYHMTLEEVQLHFTEVHSVKLFYPYHQPPEPFTFEQLNRDFGETVEQFLIQTTSRQSLNTTSV